MCAAEILPESWSVVRDGEDRYSVWPDDKALPVGWSKVPISGTRDACLQKIKMIWIDPRPLGLRRAMA
ncbi:MbtH family NRPS accessory protein (plasmid) [Phyllobacterium sp. A18/5-2]|uniref:MbtH family protein n=1 Tax=Phyllobacterium sp. A18/5-2 TaxID=2978392 RepID=UPI0021C6E0D6|nr:MbtH family NRPS accessory protein [Phyllobacterium sp. A18/5-2]UXN66733.1 MbtH family NRPS accessory protein [Phyllobacterium sp. A18/5-2]